MENTSVVLILSNIINSSVTGMPDFDNNYNNSQDFTNKSAPIQPTAPMYIVYTATMFYVMIFIVGTFGNLVVVSVIALSKSMKTSINMYLLNLCVADLLVLVVCMPTALAEIFTKEAWIFGEAMCKVVPFLENTVANASVLTILAISIERYRVVKRPLTGIEDDFFKIAVIIGVIWVVAIVTSLPNIPIAVYRGSQLVDGTPIMVCRNPIRFDWQRMYVVTIAVVFFLLPCSTLFALYFRLCLMLLKTRQFHSNDMQTSTRMISYSDRKRLRGQVINVIGFIVIIFFVCHLPLRVAGLWLTFEDKEKIHTLGLERYLNLLFSTRILFYMNHAFNPIVYNLVSTKFRNELKLLYFRRFRGVSIKSVTNTKRRSLGLSNRSVFNQNRIERHDENVNIMRSSTSSTKQEYNNSLLRNTNREELKGKHHNEDEPIQQLMGHGKGYEVSLDIRKEKVAVVFRFDHKHARKNTVMLSSRLGQQRESHGQIVD